jgi:hypothetical protein
MDVKCLDTVVPNNMMSFFLCFVLGSFLFDPFEFACLL